MAVVIAQYFKPNQNPKAAAKENVKYIQFRKGKDREGITRTLFGSDGPMERIEAYQFIDDAPKGTKFYTIIISPDPAKEDHSRDLDMEQIAYITMQTVEERVKTAVQWVAAVHQEHSDVRHIHALAAVKGRLTPPDLRALMALSASYGADSALFQRLGFHRSRHYRGQKTRHRVYLRAGGRP